jgi:ADP-heptose:LPS heptosyltransferase
LAVAPADDVHQVDRNLRLFKVIGISGEAQRMELTIPAHVENRASELLSTVMGPVLQIAHENVYGNADSLVDKTTLPELAAIIEHASLLIADHSISMHLADVFGCPMVILYSETDMIKQENDYRGIFSFGLTHTSRSHVS